MNVSITIEVPEGIFSALRLNRERFAAELRLAAAVKWYELARLSQAQAADFGLGRADFISALGRFAVSPFQVEPDDLSRELG